MQSTGPAQESTDKQLFAGAGQDVQRLAKQARKELRNKARATYWHFKQGLNQQSPPKK